jgi:hypothetical protein
MNTYLAASELDDIVFCHELADKIAKKMGWELLPNVPPDEECAADIQAMFEKAVLNPTIH